MELKQEKGCKVRCGVVRHLLDGWRQARAAVKAQGKELQTPTGERGLGFELGSGMMKSNTTDTTQREEAVTARCGRGASRSGRTGRGRRWWRAGTGGIYKGFEAVYIRYVRVWDLQLVARGVERQQPWHGKEHGGQVLQGHA